MKTIYEMINSSNNSETVKQDMKNQVGNSLIDFETTQDEFDYLKNYALEHENDSAD